MFRNLTYTTRNNAMTVTVVAILSLAFSYYFFGFVPAQQENLHKQNFRTLKTISTNTNDIIENIANLAGKQICDAWSDFRYTTNESDPKKIDSAFQHLIMNSVDRNENNGISYAQRQDTLPNAEIAYLYSADAPYKPSVIRGKEYSLVYNSKDTIKLSFNGDGHEYASSQKEYHESSILVEYNCKTNSKSFNYGIWVNMQKVISPLVNKETFEDFFLIKDKEIICGMKTGLVIDNLDTLLKRSGGIEASTVSDLSVSGQQFKIFSLPFRLTNGDKVVLCGMVSAEKYRKDTMSISGDIVLLVLLLIFLIALAFPIAKLLLMSKAERLNISDVVFTGISIVVGTSVFVLICVNLYNFKGPGKITQDDQLKNFSLELEKRFTSEIGSACRQLQVYDALISTKSFDLINLRDKPMLSYDDNFSGDFFPEDALIRTTVKSKFDSINSRLSMISSLNPRVYPYFSNVTWVDAQGMQKIKWSSSPESVDRVSVADRDFFKRIMTEKTFLPIESELPPFSLESVFSKSTGENIAVIAIKSKRDTLTNKMSDWYWYYNFPDSYHFSNLKVHVKFLEEKFKPSVIMLSAKLYSVLDPVLPPDYGFCIMDPEGKVLFHSGGAKNLNENFLDDCDNSAALKAAIYSRTSSSVTSRYQNKSYRMNISPIGKLPLFLVIFHDDDDNRTINTEVLGMTMILTLSYFAFIGLLLLILRLSLARRSKLRSVNFIFEWLWPVKNKHAAYKQIFQFIIFLIVLLIIFLLLSDSFCCILLLFTSITFILLFLYLKINQSFTGEKQTRWQTFIHLFRGRNSIFIAGVCFVLFLLNLIAWNDKSGFRLFFLFECCGTALIVFLLLRNKALVRVKGIREFNFQTSYIFMQVALLIITSIVPVIVFFKIVFDQEIILNIRHGQIYFAQKINEQSAEDKTYFENKSTSSIDSSNEINVYDDVFYNTHVHVGASGKSKKFRDNFRDSTFEQLVSMIRPTFNKTGAEEKNLAPSVSTGLLNWGQDENNLLFLQNTDFGSKTKNNVGDLTIVSQAPVYDSFCFSAYDPGGFSTLFAWLALLLFLAILYFFMRFIFSKIFATDFFEGNEFVPAAVKQNMASIRAKNIFLIGSPSSGKRTWLEEIYGPEIKSATIDLVNLNADSDVDYFVAQIGGKKTIILDHFEYGITDYELSRRKLSLLIKLFGKENRNIIILSAAHPATFIEETEKAEKLQQEKKDDDKKKTKTDPDFATDSDKWINLFGSFYEIYFPLQTMIFHSHKNNVPEFIYNECRHSPFLIPVQNAMAEFVRSLEEKNHPVSEEEIILQIQSMAHVYYDSLWHSLSKEEQYTLFDIAQDGLANTNNREIIVRLLHKGILIYDDKLKVMNRSFQNFVLTEVNGEAILSIEKNNMPKGRWARIKSPLIIILVAIAIFIFATQQETFNKVVAFITTFAAGLPILLRLISMLSFNGAGKQS